MTIEQIEVRRAELADKSEIMELNHLSYGFSASEIHDIEVKFETTYEDHLVATKNEKIVAVLRNIPLFQNIRGIFKPMGGIAMVATSPENRGQGNVRKLITETFFAEYKAGMAVSTLYAFKDSYYKHFGYINTHPHRFIEINPAWLSRWNALPEGYQIHRTSVDKATKIYETLHNHTISQFHGGVKRPLKRWNELLKNNKSPAVIVYNPDGIAEGFLSYSISGYGFQLFGEHDIGTFNRVRFLHSSLEAKHSLFYYLYFHRDQIHKVVLPLYPHESNYFSWLQGFTKVNIRQHLQTMARIINIEEAFKDIQVEGTGNFIFSISDPLAPWNTGVYKLEAIEELKFHQHNYRLDISKISSELDRTKPILSIGALTALLYGSCSISELIYFRWIHGLKKENRVILNKWFPQQTYCLSEFF
ncbi:GNAT family N-acetyltransferase [Candidatus Harpocratesius sp.]